MYINDTLKIINNLKTLGVEHLSKITVFVKSAEENEEESPEQKQLDKVQIEKTKGVAIVELEES